jgi:hypothetical protein
MIGWKKKSAPFDVEQRMARLSDVTPRETEILQ